MQAFLDNVNSKVVDDLKVSIKDGSKLCIASACFSIYAFQELKDQLKNIDELRFIFTEPSFIKDTEAKQRREFYIPRVDRERTLYGSPFEVKLRNQLTQKDIATECAEWIREKVKFKSNVTSNRMGGFISIDGDEPRPNCSSRLQCLKLKPALKSNQGRNFSISRISRN